jgi:hypothetical protein
MNAGYKARRKAKHAAQQASKKAIAPVSVGTIDLTPRVPVLSFIGAKQFRQSGQQRKGRSGHLPEHTEALVYNGGRTFAAEVEKILKECAANPNIVEVLAADGLQIDPELLQ